MKIGGKIGALVVVALMLMLPMAMNARAQSVEEVVTVPREQIGGIMGTLDTIIRGVRGLFTIDLITSGMIGAVLLPIVNILLNPLIQVLYAIANSVMGLIEGIVSSIIIWGLAGLVGCIFLIIPGIIIWAIGAVSIFTQIILFPFTLGLNVLSGLLAGMTGGFILGFINVLPGFLVGAACEVLSLKPLGAGIIGAILTPLICTTLQIFTDALAMFTGGAAMGGLLSMILMIIPILGPFLVVLISILSGIMGVASYVTLILVMWFLSGIFTPILGWITFPIRTWVLPALMQGLVGGVAGFVIKWILIRLAI